MISATSTDRAEWWKHFLCGLAFSIKWVVHIVFGALVTLLFAIVGYATYMSFVATGAWPIVSDILKALALALGLIAVFGIYIWASNYQCKR